MNRLLFVSLLAASLAAPRMARAGEPTVQAPSLHPGAIELGVSGAMSAVEGSTRGTALVRLGRFQHLGPGLAQLEGEVAYSHVSSLDALGFEATISYQHRLSATACYPYVAIAAGSREEWIGSFRDFRIPVGLTFGLRTLTSARAAVRAEYRVRHVLHDPVADFTEQQIVVGLSVLFRNTEGH